MSSKKKQQQKERKTVWISREDLENAMDEICLFAVTSEFEHVEWMERFSALMDELEMPEGTVTFDAEWEKLSPESPDMDETERALFPNETYKCSRCGNKSYFGIECSRDKYCQHCGARMVNAGRRNREWN